MVRNIALGVSLVTFAATLVLWWRFDPASADYQFVERHAWMPAFGIQYLLGVDGISLFLVVLTGFLTPLALLVLVGLGAQEREDVLVLPARARERRCSACSSRIDLFLFYMFWDFVLIPMYFLIGIWGYERRIYAAVKFILYTMAGSVLMLVAIIGLAYAHAAADAARRASTCSICYDADAVAGRWRRGSSSRSRVAFADQGAAVPVPHVAARRARRGADRRAPSSWPASC